MWSLQHEPLYRLRLVSATHLELPRRDYTSSSNLYTILFVSLHIAFIRFETATKRCWLKRFLKVRMRNGQFYFAVQGVHAQPRFIFSRWIRACATVLFMSFSGSCHFASATHTSKFVHSVHVSPKIYLLKLVSREFTLTWNGQYYVQFPHMVYSYTLKTTKTNHNMSFNYLA